MFENTANQYVSCPKCSSQNAQKVNYTWWGGVIGPRLMSHVKCQTCKTKYNGKTGKSNTLYITLYFVAIAVLFAVFFSISFFSRRG